MQETPINQELDKLVQQLQGTIAESEDLIFWEFQYRSRYAHDYFRAEVVSLVSRLKKVINKLIDPLLAFHESNACFVNLINSLIYAWHQSGANGSLKDFKFEPECQFHIDFISTLDHEERAIIDRLHQLSIENGFSIVELCSPLNHMGSLIEELSINGESFQKLIQPKLVFPIPIEKIYGVYLVDQQNCFTAPSESGIYYYLKFTEKDSHIENNVKKYKLKEGVHHIGEACHSDLLIFIKTPLLKSIKDTQQVISHTIRQRFLYFLSHEKSLNDDEDPTFTPSPLILKEQKPFAKTRDQIRLGSDLVGKRWDRNTNNLRRAVGLFIYDLKNYHEEIQATFPIVRDLLKEKIDIYDPNYTKNKRNEKDAPPGIFFDWAEIDKAINRKFYWDLELATRCINERSYLTLSDL